MLNEVTCVSGASSECIGLRLVMKNWALVLRWHGLIGCGGLHSSIGARNGFCRPFRRTSPSPIHQHHHNGRRTYARSARQARVRRAPFSPRYEMTHTLILGQIPHRPLGTPLRGRRPARQGHCHLRHQRQQGQALRRRLHKGLLQHCAEDAQSVPLRSAALRSRLLHHGVGY